MIDKTHRYKNQKGVTLFLSLLVLGILFSIGFSLSIALINQIAVIRGIGNSVVAFYAADTGIEKSLYLDRSNIGSGGSTGCDVLSPCSLDNSSEYDIVYDAGCGSGPTGVCIKSTGTFQGVKRAIEVEY